MHLDIRQFLTLETILARSMNLGVLGISAITNIVGDPSKQHEEITSAAKASSARLTKLLDHVIGKL